MAESIGLALEATVVRAVSRVRGAFTCHEVPWDPAKPESAIDALRDKFGTVSGLSIAVGLGFLEVARPELPPLAPADATRVLLRDADRYFPVEGRVAVAMRERGAVAFATNSDALERWVSAFETWARVRAVFAAPDAVAQAVGTVSGRNNSDGSNAARTSSAFNSALYAIDAAQGERGVLRIHDGYVQEARRISAIASGPVATDVEAVSDSLFGIDGKFAAAIGALDAIDGDPQGMLLNHSLGSVIKRKRRARAGRSYVLLATSAAVLFAALSYSHARELMVTRQLADSLESVSAPGLLSDARLLRDEKEVQILTANAARRNDALQVLATLSSALPRDAFVERVAWDGSEWRIEGSTVQSASIVPALDAQVSLSSVRVLNASTRFRDGNQTRESFSIAFRTKGVANVAP